MHRHELTGEQWVHLGGLPSGRRSWHGSVNRDYRLFLNAVWVYSVSINQLAFDLKESPV
jgi:hypothetical protein